MFKDPSASCQKQEAVAHEDALFYTPIACHQNSYKTPTRSAAAGTTYTTELGGPVPLSVISVSG